MSAIGRTFLRGKPLGKYCLKATICHEDFWVGEDSYDTCWGLVDPATEGGPWPECQECRAFYLNIPDSDEWADYVREARR